MEHSATVTPAAFVPNPTYMSVPISLLRTPHCLICGLGLGISARVEVGLCAFCGGAVGIHAGMLIPVAWPLASAGCYKGVP